MNEKSGLGNQRIHPRFDGLNEAIFFCPQQNAQYTERLKPITKGRFATQTFIHQNQVGSHFECQGNGF